MSTRTGNVTTPLSVGHGGLTVLTNVTNGLTAGEITGNGGSSVVLAGTLTQINNTLAATNGLVYNSGSFAGVDTLTVITQDQGTTGPLTATSTVTLDDNSANPFTLTTGTDTVFFTSGTNVVNSSNTATNTLNNGDILTGGSGTDTLNVAANPNY